MPEQVVAAGIRWVSVGPLLLIAAAIMGSPGPATISLVAAGSVYGIRRSLPYLVGIIAGTTAVLIAVASGITAVLLAVPGIRSVLIWVAAAYILWLAYHIATAPPLAAPGSGPPAFSVAGGAFLGIANPKAWVAIAAVFASVRLADSATVDAAAKVAILTAVIILICATWLMAGSSIAPMLRNRSRARIVNLALAAALLLATGLAMLH
jgi:threonine/homoserine/homoserine lactone efflux protein